MRFIKRSSWLILLLLAATACSYAPSRNAAPTKPIFIPPAGSATAISASDSTPTPTTVSATPTPVNGFIQGDWIILKQAGFAFTMPVNIAAVDQPYVLQQHERQASISSQDEVLLISIISDDGSQAATAEDCLDLVLERMTAALADVVPEPAEAIQVGSKVGLSSGVKGDLFEEDFTGRLVGVIMQPGTCLTAFAVALGAQADERWQQEGEGALELILTSMVFSEVSPGNSACEVSSDPEYAFSMDKPVRLGNTDLYDGFAREQAYLSALRGPLDEEITFARVGSDVNKAGDILDVYEVTYTGLAKALKLYLDMYTYEEPLAPVGFTCPGPIPVRAP
jgi:hypothetical protein